MMLTTKQWLQGVFFSITCATAIFLGGCWYVVQYPLLDRVRLSEYSVAKPSLVLDRNGKELARFQEDTREYVRFSRMPHHLIQAFIAAEDWNFFNHTGLSLKGIVRSALVNMYHGKKVQGASTITQQLVKLCFFDSRKTFIRKFKEQAYALLIERQYTKEQILECYLNSLYFGSGIYGVQNAAKRFWNKNIDDISVDQSALLAAIIRSPGNYSPLHFPLSAQKKRNVVLGKMKKLGFIIAEMYDNALHTEVHVVEQKKENGLLSLAVQEYFRSWIQDRYGRDMLYRGGLILQTTLDATLQQHAEKVFVTHLKKLRLRYGGDLDGGFISLEVHSGAIRALVPGVDTYNYFNRVFCAKRQQGSAFKPLVYAAALEAGMSFCDTAVDEPLQVNGNGQVWEPRNYTRTFEGPMTLARALVYSNNIITTKVILAIGPEKVVNLAQRCHIGENITPYPSLALGCLDSTLVEVGGMFNIFPNGGFYVEPHLISWVKDARGKKIYKTQISEERVISSKIASQVGQVLSIGLERKRSSLPGWIDSEGMSKTGTTNDSRTCWFVGATPELTTAVYVGCDDNRPMGRNVFPVHTAFPIWLNFHKLVPTQHKKFLYDSSLQSIFVHSKTGEFVESYDNKDIYKLLV